MLQIFGVTLPTNSEPVSRNVLARLARRMAAAAVTLRAGAPAALAAGVRADAQQYLRARRQGALRIAGAAAQQCDEYAWALMGLTLDAPPLPSSPERLVA